MGKEISNQKADQESAKINQHLNKQRNSPEKEARFFFTKLKERANRNQQFGWEQHLKIWNLEEKQTEISSQSAGRSRADSPIYHPKLATGDAKQHDDDGDGDDHGDDDVDDGDGDDVFPFKCNFMV